MRPFAHASVFAGFLTFALLVPAPADASELTDAQARLDVLRREIALQEEALRIQHEELDSLQAELGEVEAARASVLTQLLRLREAMDVVQTRHAELEARADAAVRTAYERGPFGAAAIALGADSMVDLADTLQYFDSITRSTIEATSALAAETGRLMAARASLEALTAAGADQELEFRAKEGLLLDGLLDREKDLAALAASREEAAALVATLSLPSEPELTGSGVSYGRWAELLLGRIGAPICVDNLTILVAWQAAEGTAAAHNPLATTHGFAGATDFNAVGVKNYPSLDAGLDATIETLHGPEAYGYGPILGALDSCAPAMTTAQAINASSWCRGCAGGMYVLNVVPLVQADYDRFAER
jgi:hypothetical protein